MVEEGTGQDAVMQFETKQLQVSVTCVYLEGFNYVRSTVLIYAFVVFLVFTQWKELQSSRNELLSRVANLKKVCV